MNYSRWGNAEKTSRSLGVSIEGLSVLRDNGYLKEGTHWIETAKPEGMLEEHTMNNEESKKVFSYNIPWCLEELRTWKARDAKMPLSKT